MKVLSNLIFHFFVLQIAFSQSTATVYGKITNPTSNTVYIRYYRDLVSYKQVFADSARLDHDGRFAMTFPWKKSFQAEFVHGKEMTKMFIGVGDNIKIELDANRFDESIIYSGKGAEANNYLAQKELKFPKGMASGIYKMQEKEFVNFIDSLHNAQLNLFNSYFSKIGNKSSSTKAFKEYEDAEINYYCWEAKNDYPGMYTYFNKLKDDVILSDSYYSFLKQVSINNNKALNSISYLQFVDSYINEDVRKIYKQDTTKKIIEIKEELIEKHLTGETKSYALANWAYGILNRNSDVINGKRIIEKYKSNSKDKQYAQMLDQAFKEAARLAVGNPAPTFSYADLTGKMVSLTDFKGKIVYLDIWASWCGPCLMEIPHAKKLKEQLEEKDVVFLYVSIDENEEAWKKLVTEKELKGVHLISKGNFNSDISKLYNVRGIPRYFIIDKEGKIADNNAKRPSGNVQRDLEEFLK